MQSPPNALWEQPERSLTWRFLEEAHTGADLLHLAEDPLATAVVGTINTATIEGIYNAARDAILSTRAWMFIRFDYSKCEKVHCKSAPWRLRNAWVHHSVTEWKQAKVGMDANMQWFWGIEEAAGHLDENVKQLQAEEFGADSPNETPLDTSSSRYSGTQHLLHRQVGQGDR